MTAPSPAGLSPLLDQLDEARAKATPGPWRADEQFPEYFGSEDQGGLGQTRRADDAALIVAAVNALPQLTAALRAVAELADSYPLGTDVPVYRLHRILAALTPGADTAGATA